MKYQFQIRLCAFWAFMILIILHSNISLHAADAKKLSGSIPKMVIPESIHDFGVVPEGEIVEYNFIIRNEGNAELELKRVKPG